MHRIWPTCLYFKLLAWVKGSIAFSASDMAYLRSDLHFRIKCYQQLMILNPIHTRIRRILRSVFSYLYDQHRARVLDSRQWRISRVAVAAENWDGFCLTRVPFEVSDFIRFWTSGATDREVGGQSSCTFLLRGSSVKYSFTRSAVCSMWRAPWSSICGLVRSSPLFVAAHAFQHSSWSFF